MYHKTNYELFLLAGVKQNFIKYFVFIPKIRYTILLPQATVANLFFNIEIPSALYLIGKFLKRIEDHEVKIM